MLEDSKREPVAVYSTKQYLWPSVVCRSSTYKGKPIYQLHRGADYYSSYYSCKNKRLLMRLKKPQ